ncbi:MAG: exo-alpha-sialidase [Verrucomicrobiota bacterium]
MKLPLPCIAAASCLPFIASAIDESKWKLQALKYNNPGLVVDLGVGLWAWPLPLDYDDDGDLDLLVSCDDKPSNGFYFFENPGTEPGEKFPVFKPGVWLGPTKRNAQISYVDGEPRLLLEKWELPNFKDGDFETQEQIYPTIHVHGGRQTRARMFRYADWEGDGDQDLVVGVGDWGDYVWDHAYDANGNWRNGPLHGWIYLVEREDGKWKKPVKIKANGASIDVYGWPSPNLRDFDDDGDLDLLCGEFLDGFTYFENIGTRSAPVYATGKKLTGSDGNPLVMHLQMITPTAIDWDNDGDEDLIVGDEDGRVALVENVTPDEASTPVFHQPVYFQQEADTLKFGALVTPFAHDWDGDGDEDLVCGNTAGNIAVFTNLDGVGQQWSAPELVEADGEVYRQLAGPDGSIQGPAEAKWGYTTLSVADWDADGRDDLIVNGIWPKLQLLRRTEAGSFTEQSLPFWTEESAPDFYWWNRLAQNLQTQWRTTPLATDFDEDGQLDLVILDQEGYLTCQSRAREETRIFIDEDNQPIRLATRTAGRSGRFKLAVVDWDQDGRTDLLVNSENATWYRNCEDREGRIVLKRVGNLTDRNVSGHTSSPTVADFDGNGTPDLIVGSENGRIYHIAHEDCIQFSESETTARAPAVKSEQRFPGLVSEGFIFGELPTKECHASTLAETTRGLVAAWFGGTKERNPDVEIWTSYDDGAGWSKPKAVANGVQHSELRYPTWNPVLYQPRDDESTLYLFFKVGPHPREWWGEMMVSYDRGRSFRDRRRLPEGIDGPVRGKAYQLTDGTTLFPGSTEMNEDWRFHMERVTRLSPDLEKTRFNRVESKTQPYQVIQPTLLSHPDGTLQALLRSQHKRVVQSFSKDGGVTWSELELTDLPNNNAGIEALTLHDGRHLLVYNHIEGDRDRGWGKRNQIHLAISIDGQSWQAAAVLEKAEQGEFSYPAMIQTSDGKVHISYTWNRKKIRHLVILPEDLKTKPLSSFDS